MSFLETLWELSWRDTWLLATVVLSLVIIFDDLFVDILAVFVKAKPSKMSQADFDLMNAQDQKRIAILMAHWQESTLIERMAAGNIQNIDYQNYEIFLGVYPNDKLSLEAARRAEKKFSNIRVIVNTMQGPTSKGQMINHMVRYINEFNQSVTYRQYDLLLTHDAEDMIHRYSLKLINLRSQKYDFIQIPVFSQPVPMSHLTEGIYVDEFTDSHTKNLIVRDHYRAGIPSAGVGTAVSASVVSHLLELQDGHFLKENTLTEDYFLGLTCYDLNVKAHFDAEYIEYKDTKTGEIKRDYVATREHFPQTFRKSIKQKTRWIMGICLQSFEQKSRKSKTLFGSYFLWRDRKGLWCLPLFVSGVAFLTYFVYTYFVTGDWPRLSYTPYRDFFETAMLGNLMLALLRMAERVVLVSRVYGFKGAILVPVRWVLSYFINNIATFNALYLWTTAKIKGEVPKWSKTEHMIPVGFGLKDYDFVEEVPLRSPQRPDVRGLEL